MSKDDVIAKIVAIFSNQEKWEKRVIKRDIQAQENGVLYRLVDDNEEYQRSQVMGIIVDNEEDIKQIKDWLKDNTLKMTLEKIKIIDLELSVRSANSLMKAGIDTLSKLTNTAEDKLREIENLPERSIREIKNMLAERNLTLKNGVPLTPKKEEKNDKVLEQKGDKKHIALCPDCKTKMVIDEPKTTVECEKCGLEFKVFYLN
ncbi:MAG: DNA-directed RNA polymerase subunit alpha C-terminal domain-containing protein [Bacillota bacterium]